MIEMTDLRTDAGLCHALREVARAGSWDVPVGQRLLAEVRRRAANNAARVARVRGIARDRGLVDDVMMAAWMVLARHTDQVMGAARPWAYVMSSAQRTVSAEVRAQRSLSSTASVTGRRRHFDPPDVYAVGASSSDLATAFQHGMDSRPTYPGPGGSNLPRHLVPARRVHGPVLVQPPADSSPAPQERKEWFVSFIGLLVERGADRSVTIAAVDHLANVFTTTPADDWEHVARRDPVLAQLGLLPDQAGALVGLMAGSRRERRNSQGDSLLAAVRAASDRGVPAELSAAQVRRARIYVGDNAANHRPIPASRPQATAPTADEAALLAG